MGALKIKISLPRGWGENLSLLPFLERNGTLQGHDIFCDNQRNVADAWIVFDDVNLEDNRCVVPRNRLFLVTAESVWADDYWLNPASALFLEQFPVVSSSHYANHPGYLRNPPFLPWMVHGNHGSVWAPHRLDLEALRDLEPPEKTNELSVICSSKAGYPGHRVRLDFVRRLKNHFGERLHWFGNGINPLDEKIEGLASYKATIAIENQIRPDLYTEKLIDPLLAYTVPIYAGAPNVSDYFDLPSAWKIDLRDFSGSLEKIENLLSDDFSEATRDALLANRATALDEAHFLRRVVDLVESAAPAAADTEEFFLTPLARPRATGRLTEKGVGKLLSRARKVLG